MSDKRTDRGPSWWSERHESAWQRVQEALRRDWEQTKADLTRTRGHDLHQGVLDTIKQALGTEPLPLFSSEPAAHPEDDHWFRVHHAVRYGYGAYTQYDDHEEWDEDLERKLQSEWEEMTVGPAWDVIKDDVRRGWTRAGTGARDGERGDGRDDCRDKSPLGPAVPGAGRSQG